MNFDDMSFADVIRLEKRYGATLGSASRSPRAKKSLKGKGRASKIKQLPTSLTLKKREGRIEIPATV